MINFKEDISSKVKCFDILWNCVSIEHILDAHYIYDKLKEYKNVSKEIPVELSRDTKKYINRYILPMLDDDYWESYLKESHGKYSNESFEVKDTDSPDYLYFRVYAKSISLINELLKVFSKYKMK